MSASHGLLVRVRGWFTTPHPSTPTPAPTPTPTPRRADHGRIAVLEHQLLGIEPQPGTPEAVAVALATPVDQERCPHQQAVDVTQFGQARATALCTACGADLVAGDDGGWARP